MPRVCAIWVFSENILIDNLKDIYTHQELQVPDRGT